MAPDTPPTSAASNDRERPQPREVSHQPVFRRVVLHAMGKGFHEKLCGTPPSCGKSWRHCAEAGIRHEDIAAMMTGLADAGLKVVRR